MALKNFIIPKLNIPRPPQPPPRGGVRSFIDSPQPPQSSPETPERDLGGFMPLPYEKTVATASVTPGRPLLETLPIMAKTKPMPEKESRTIYDKRLLEIRNKYPQAPYTSEQMRSDWYKKKREEETQAFNEWQYGHIGGRPSDPLSVAKVFGEGLTKLPKQTAAAVLQATQGQGGASVVDKDWADRFIEDAKVDLDKFVAEVNLKYKDKITPELARFPQNAAFSLTSMGAGLGVGVPTALIPLPGARVAAFALGSAASGAVAYSMTTYQIMQQYLELKDAEKKSTTGKGLTPADEKRLKAEFESKARAYGLWEAVPEAISNLAFARILTLPLGKMVGKSMASAIIQKLIGMYGQELLTETITQKGQSDIEVEAGLREGKISWGEAFKEIAPQTFLLTTIMGGAGQIGVSSYNRIKSSLKKEIGENHPMYKEIMAQAQRWVDGTSAEGAMIPPSVGAVQGARGELEKVPPGIQQAAQKDVFQEAARAKAEVEMPELLSRVREKEKGVKPTTRPMAKDAWALTLDQYIAKYGRKGQDIGIQRAFFSQNHKQIVNKALSEGKPVPPEVLKDYPDLAKAEVTPPITAQVEAPRAEVPQPTTTAPTTPVAPPEVVSEGIPPTEPPKTPIDRRNEVKGLLTKPAKELPKGTTKVELRQELVKLNKEILPQEKKLRQRIMASAMGKGLGVKQREGIFKEVGGSRHLPDINEPVLTKVLSAVEKARPIKIKGKNVIRVGTERAIQSLRQSLISDGKMSEDTYKAILKHQRLTLDKFESPSKFITESEGSKLLQEMNYQSEVGLMKRDIAIEKALESNLAIKDAVDKVNSRIAKEGIGIEGKPVKVSPLWDMRYYTQKLQARTGGRFYDVWQMANLKHLANYTELGRLIKKIEGSTPAYKKIASDEKALQRVSDYIEAKNKWSKIESPADITGDEIKIANAIEKILLDFQPTVRYQRFKNAYSKYGDKIDRIMEDIPDASRDNIKEAIKIYESQGDKALREYLKPKTWGVIGSGYEPHIAVNPKLVTYKVKETVVGKGHLKSREGIELAKADKDIIKRTSSYARQMLNLELQPYLVEMDRIYGETLHKLKDPYATKGHLQLAMNELKGYIQDGTPIVHAISKVASWGYTAVFLSPHLSFRNLFQNLAFHPDRGAILNPANHKLNPQDMAYFSSYVTQFSNIARDLLLQSELGTSRAARMARRISYYGLSDQANRYASFWGSLNKARRSLQAYKKTGDLPKFIDSSGLNDVTNIQRKEALGLLAQDKVTIDGIGEVSGEQAATWYIAREITNNTHFLYERAQRAPFEMGLTGRTIGSLLVFGRSVSQRMLNQINTMQAGSKTTPGQKLRATKILLGMIVFGLIAGEMYKDITGKGTPVWKATTPGEAAQFVLQRNPYNPLNVLSWSPGGLAIGVSQDIANVVRLLFQSAQGDTFAMSELTIALPALGDVIVPFYGITMNMLETATGTKYIDRKALRDVRAKFDKDYMPNEEFYQKERGIIGQIQHALFGGEQPEPSEVEVVKETIETSLQKIGLPDEEARQRAIDRASTPNEIVKIQDKDWVYTMSDLASDIGYAVKGMDMEETSEENGFPPIVNEYLNATPLIDEYFDQMTDDRWEYREDNPETEAALVIWRGYMKMSTPECETIVRRFIRDYDIPESAIPALASPIETPTGKLQIPKLNIGGNKLNIPRLKIPALK